MGIRIIDERTLEKLKQLVKELLEKSRRFRSQVLTTEWLDNGQVCMLLDISKRSLQTYRDKGILPYSQIGHKCYYKRTDIEKLLQQVRVEYKPDKKIINYGKRRNNQ